MPFAARQCLPLALIAAGLAVVLMGAFWTRTSSLAPTDDGLIPARTANVFFDCGVLSFNKTGDRVEANSSLLFTLLISAGFFLADGMGIVWYILAINAVFTTLSIALLYFLCRDQGLARPWCVLAAVMMTVTPAISFWTASALEAPLVMALQLGMLLAACAMERGTHTWRTHGLLAALIAIMVVTRPDSFVTPLFILAYLAVCRGRWRLAAGQLAVLAIAFATVAAWRYAYYGWLFPNTVYVKAGGGFANLFGFAWDRGSTAFVHSGLWLYLLPLAGCALYEAVEMANRLRRGQNPFHAASLFPWFAVYLIGYWFAHGGDIYYERMLIVLFPLGLLAIVRALDQIRQRSGGREVAMLAPLCVFGVVSPLLFSPAYYDFKGFNTAAWPAFPFYERDVRLAASIQRNHPHATSGAVDKLGAISYSMDTDSHIYDIFGLADEHIAHQPPKRSASGQFVAGHAKFDLDHTLGMAPDFVYVVFTTTPALTHPFIPDLDRAYLESRGYRLAYFSNWRTCHVLDVRDRPVNEALQIVNADGGYNIAVYMRRQLPSMAGTLVSRTTGTPVTPPPL